MKISESSVQLSGCGRRCGQAGARHGELPTVGQVCVLGQLLQLPAEVGRFVHALLLGYLEHHVFLQQLLDSLLVRVPVLAQEEGRSEAPALRRLPSCPQDEGTPYTCSLPKKPRLQGTVSNPGPAVRVPATKTPCPGDLGAEQSPEVPN